jgi:hypothetical protein
VDVLAQGDLIAPSILWLMEEIVAGFVAGGVDYPQAADGYRAGSPSRPCLRLRPSIELDRRPFVFPCGSVLIRTDRVFRLARRVSVVAAAGQ